MSRVTSSLGRARNSSHVQRRGSSTSPTMEKSHWSSGVCGVGPAERTGKSGVTYWPGGTRSPGTSSRRRPLKPRDMIGGISLLLTLGYMHPQHPVRATIGSARHWHGSAHRLLAAFVPVVASRRSASWRPRSSPPAIPTRFVFLSPEQLSNAQTREPLGRFTSWRPPCCCQDRTSVGRHRSHRAARRSTQLPPAHG